MSSSETSSAKNSIGWIVALAVLCGAILGYGLLYSKNSISDPAYLTGQYLVYGILIWALFYTIFLRGRGGQPGAIAFAAIFVSLLAGGLYAAEKSKGQVQIAVSSVQEELSRVAKASRDPDGFATRIERSPASAPKAEGEFGEMERVMKRFIDTFAALQNDYLSELNAIGWNSILDANRLRQDPALSETRTILTRAKVIVAKYRQKTLDSIAEGQEHIGRLNLSASTKKQMSDGYARGMKKGVDQAENLWELENQILLEVGNIVSLLGTSGWEVQGTTLVFHRDLDLDKYKSYLANIEKLGTQQEQARQGNLAAVEKRLEDIKQNAAR